MCKSVQIDSVNGLLPFHFTCGDFVFPEDRGRQANMGTMMHWSSGKADYDLYEGTKGPTAQHEKFNAPGYLSSRAVVLKRL